MPLSRYLKVFPDPDQPGQSLVFSTRRGSLTRLPEAVLERLSAGATDLPEDAAATLGRVAVLVDDLEAEQREVLGYLDEINRVSPTITAAVIVGMACNFACPYCYEGADKGAGAMDDPTEEALVAYLLARLGPGRERLMVDVYGGEPLLYLERIKTLAADLQAGCAERGVCFELSLVTNASLLAPAVPDDLLPQGLKSLKVTLDGPPDLHDRTRPYRHGGGSFQDILRNLAACAHRVTVGVSGNYTRENWRRFPELLDHLGEGGLGPERIAQVQFAPVLQTDGGGGLACAGCASAAEPWLVEAAVALNRAVRDRGYRAPKVSPAPCMADLDYAVTVNWDGTLTRCPGLINRPEYVVGTLTNGITADPDPFRTPRWQDRDECRQCTWLPLCFGGCRFLQLQRTGTLAGVDCMRPFWEEALEGLVR